jgi:uncharacterized protein (DUF302 family)
MNTITKTILLTALLLTGMTAKDVTTKEESTKKVETPKVLVKKTEAKKVDANRLSDIQVFTANNKDGKITPKTIQKAFEKAGFFISANRDMNTPFKKQFKETNFDVYNLFTFYKKDLTLELAKKYDNVGLFAPMSMSIYTKKGADTISVATLSAEAMAKIMKIPADDKTLKALRALVVKTLKEALPNGKFEALPYKIAKPKGELVSSYSMELDEDEWEDELDEFKMGFEGSLAPNGFVIAGENNLGDDFDDANYTGYDFYEVYSVCKLPVIYTISKTHPEAGAFAPCSLYLEKKKDDKNMKIGFPSVYNWMSSLNLTDKKDMAVLEDAQKRMNKMISSLIE